MRGWQVATHSIPSRRLRHPSRMRRPGFAGPSLARHSPCLTPRLEKAAKAQAAGAVRRSTRRLPMRLAEQPGPSPRSSRNQCSFWAPVRKRDDYGGCSRLPPQQCPAPIFRCPGNLAPQDRDLPFQGSDLRPDVGDLHSIRRSIARRCKRSCFQGGLTILDR